MDNNLRKLPQFRTLRKRHLSTTGRNARFYAQKQQTNLSPLIAMRRRLKNVKIVLL